MAAVVGSIERHGETVARSMLIIVVVDTNKEAYRDVKADRR